MIAERSAEQLYCKPKRFKASAAPMASALSSNTEAHLIIPADIFQCHPMPLCYSKLSRPQRFSTTLCNAVAPTTHLADVVALRHIIMVLRCMRNPAQQLAAQTHNFTQSITQKQYQKYPPPPFTSHPIHHTRQHESSRGVTWIASPL